MRTHEYGQITNIDARFSFGFPSPSTALDRSVVPFAALRRLVVHAYLQTVTTPSPSSYNDPSPPNYPDYGYRTESSKVPLEDQLFRLIMVAALVSSGFLIQLVAICIAYWAFKHRKSCDCCYDDAGVPNFSSAPPDLSFHPLPSPSCERHTINGLGCWQ